MRLLLILLTFIMSAVQAERGGEGKAPILVEMEDLQIPEILPPKQDESSQMTGYMNIILFGVDAQNEEWFRKLQDETENPGFRSDGIMIASINLLTGDIKLVSVYRDTYLNDGTDSYRKCGSFFARGGPRQAMQALNMNLDMDIEKFVVVGYGGMIELIDALGGVWIDVDEAELKSINDCQRGIVVSWKYGVQLTYDSDPGVFDVIKETDYVPVTETGYQLLNGLQATAYCRIRSTKGNDIKRTERQREVLTAIETQAKALAPAELVRIFNIVIEDVYTNIEAEDMLVMLDEIMNYHIVAEDGFPQAQWYVTGNIGAKGSCFVPRNLEANVVWLHKFLFDEDDYEVSATVKEIDRKIKEDTDKYLNE